MLTVPNLPDSIANIILLPLLAALSLFVGWAASARGRDLPPLGLPERPIAYVLLGIVAISWAGVLIAALDLFRWPLLVGLLAALCGWRVLRAPHLQVLCTSEGARHLGRQSIVATVALALLLVGAGWLYARPSESYLLVDDSSVYTLGGIVLARDGALVYREAPVYEYEATLPGDYWTEAAATPSMAAYADLAYQFYPSEAVAAVLTRHYGPFFPTSLTGSTVEIGFLPLPKVWVALVVWLFGAGHAVWPVCFFGVVGLTALYALSSRVLGWRVGLGAVLLLGLSAVQVWFARLPISEIHAQVVLLSGLFLVALMEQASGAADLATARRCARWAGLAFGALTVLRLEAAAVLGVLAAFLVLAWGRRAWADPARRELFLVAGVSGLVGTVISVLRAPFYWFTRLLTVFSPGLAHMAIGGLLAGLVAAVLVWRLWPRLRAVGRDALPTALASVEARGAVVTPALLGLWVLVGGWHLLRRDASSSLAGWLVQYWTWPGLILGVAGGLALGLRRRPRSAGLHALLGGSVTFLLLFSFTILVSPLHPWAMRRLVPLILPALAVSTAWALLELPRHILARWRGAGGWMAPVVGVVGVAALLALGYGLWQRTEPILFHADREGLWQQLVALNERLPEDAVLLFDDGNEGRAMPQVMDLVFRHPSYVLNDSEAIRPDSLVVDRLIRSAQRRGRQVFFLNIDPTTQWWPEKWDLVHVGAHEFAMPILQQVRGRPPLASDITEHRFAVQIYHLDRRTEGVAATATLPDGLDVPLGPEGYPYLRRGLFPAEQGSDGVAYRWTDGDALVAMPWLAADPAESVGVCLRFSVGTWRPGDQDAPHLQVTVENEVVYDATLDPAAGEETVALSLSAVRNTGVDDLEIRFLSNTWNAARFSQGQDQRELGVVLRDVEVRPLEQCEGVAR